MTRPKTKTTVTTLKLTPHMRELWAEVAKEQNRSLTNAFESLLLDYAKRQGISVPAEEPATK